MSSNHKRNVSGMHDAPRCEAETKAGDPCGNPAVKGKKRCHVHGGMGAQGKNYRQETNHYKAAYLHLEQQLNVHVRKLGKIMRKIERSGDPAVVLDGLKNARRELLLLTKQKQSDHAAAYRPPEAEVMAKREEAAALDTRRRYSGKGHRSLEMIRDRARGAMLGLAVGEAVGLTLAGWPRDSYEVEDMHGGGLLGLKPGEWAGDTAMALALMESLTYRHLFDETDFIERLIDWRDDGEYSCTGFCLSMGATTEKALKQYERTGDPVAGEFHADCVANGSLARIAPVAIRYWKQRAGLRDVAIRQSLTTHAGPIVVPACVGFAEILSDAIFGLPRDEVLRPREVYLSSSLRPVLVGEWQDKRLQHIRGCNNAMMSLEAALWCVGKTESFEEAVLKAANLGEDSGSTAALAGQLAGALYGACAIPERWIEKLAWRDKILKMTDALFDQSRSRAGNARS